MEVLTCKLPVRCPPASKLCHQLSIGLKDEDAAGFVVHSDDVSVLIHSNTLWTHEPASPDLILGRRDIQETLVGERYFTPATKGGKTVFSSYCCVFSKVLKG